MECIVLLEPFYFIISVLCTSDAIEYNNFVYIEVLREEAWGYNTASSCIFHVYKATNSEGIKFFQKRPLLGQLLYLETVIF